MRVIQCHASRAVLLSLTGPTMNSATLLQARGTGTVRVFRQTFLLEDAIDSHACSLEALACV
jgi:hypothetical protein